MPVYEYFCKHNGVSLEVVHSVSSRLNTWGELCRFAGCALGDTPESEPIERLLFASGVSMPHGDVRLKEMGFTKLVKRDNGVYENVTASGSEKRYMQAGDQSSLPNFKNKIAD